MTKNKTTKNYSSQFKFLYSFTKKELMAMTVVLSVGIIGISTILFSGATPNGRVNFYIFCPQTGGCGSFSLTDMRTNASVIRSWYAGQLGSNRTFDIANITVRYATHANSYYSDGGNNPDRTLGYIATDLGITNTYDPSSRNVVLTSFHIFYGSYAGWGSTPGAIGVTDGTKTSSVDLRRELMAHELGHNFNLNHVTVNNSLMKGTSVCSNASNYSVAFSSCTLYSPQKTQLLQNYPGWFPVH